MKKVNSKNMMDYVDKDLELIVNNIAEDLELNTRVWVEEFSDGKYKIFNRKNDENKFVEVTAWDDKKSFAESLYYLFNQ